MGPPEIGKSNRKSIRKWNEWKKKKKKRGKSNSPRRCKEGGIRNQHASWGEGNSTQQKQVHELPLAHVRNSIGRNAGGLTLDLQALSLPHKWTRPCELGQQSMGWWQHPIPDTQCWDFISPTSSVINQRRDLECGSHHSINLGTRIHARNHVRITTPCSVHALGKLNDGDSL